MAPWGAAVPLVPELRFGAAGLGRRRISRPSDASVSWGGGVWERLRCGCRWHRECCGWRAAMRAAPGLRALGRFVDAGWQDLRAVHDSRGPCSEKCPFLAGSSRGVSSGGDLRGISDAWRADLARASPFSDAWRANLAANWRFSRPRPLSGCMERKTCHGLLPGNAPRRNLATARPPGNAPCENIATASQAKSASGRNPDAAELRVLQAVRALAVAQPADCRVAAERVVNIAKLVSVPQRRSARHHVPRCHAPYAALLSPLKK